MGVPLTSEEKDNRKEACKTYIEQTKLLVALASAFIVAPIAIIGYVKNDKNARILDPHQMKWLVSAEGFYILSILLGYVVLGALAGTQSDGNFDVFRPAIRIGSLLQLACYLIGIAIIAVQIIKW